MQTVSDKLKEAAEKACASSVGGGKGGCALYTNKGKLYTGFYVEIEELIIHPVDMALGLALGDRADRFMALYLCGEAFEASSLKRLARFGDIMVNGEKDGKEFRATLNKLILALGEK